MTQITRKQLLADAITQSPIPHRWLSQMIRNGLVRSIGNQWNEKFEWNVEVIKNDLSESELESIWEATKCNKENPALVLWDELHAALDVAGKKAEYEHRLGDFAKIALGELMRHSLSQGHSVAPPKDAICTEAWAWARAMVRVAKEPIEGGA